MNGGLVPMRGSGAPRARPQNAWVKKHHPLSLATPSGGAGSARGFTLIEVMIALIILVIGVLGAVAMTLTALRDNKQSALRTTATAMAYELGELMRSNPGQEGIFTGTQPSTSAIVAACYTTGCVQSDLATSDYAQWLAKLTYSGTNVTAGTAVAGLPNASVKVCRDSTSLTSMTVCDNLATSPLVVKMKWDERYNNSGTYANVVASGVNTPNLVVAMQPY
jgi:type IV pilus assembly protein PilV